MRFYNTGPGDTSSSQFDVPTIKRRDADGVVKEYVMSPPPFSGCVCGPSGQTGVTSWDGVCRCGRAQFFEHKPGNAYLPLFGFGFYVIPKGGFIDLPHGCPARAVTAIAPHLVPEEQYEMERQQQQKAEAAQEKTDKKKA